MEVTLTFKHAAALTQLWSIMVNYGQLSVPEIPGPIRTNSICECHQTLSRFSCESLAPRDYSNTWHTHTYANNSDDGHRASTRAVRVVQLFSMADSRTERLRVLISACNSRRCIARMYLIQPSLMSAGFRMKYRRPRIVASQKRAPSSRFV